MLSNQWIDQQNAVHPNTEILLNNKKEQNYWHTNNVDEYQKHNAKWQKSGTKIYKLHDSIYDFLKKGKDLLQSLHPKNLAHEKTLNKNWVIWEIIAG